MKGTGGVFGRTRGQQASTGRWFAGAGTLEVLHGQQSDNLVCTHTLGVQQGKFLDGLLWAFSQVALGQSPETGALPRHATLCPARACSQHWGQASKDQASMHAQPMHAAVKRCIIPNRPWTATISNGALC